MIITFFILIVVLTGSLDKSCLFPINIHCVLLAFNIKSFLKKYILIVLSVSSVLLDVMVLLDVLVLLDVMVLLDVLELLDVMVLLAGI